MLRDVEGYRIRDKAKIREVMHAHMLQPKEQKAPWICEIFSREHRAGGWIYECAKVVSACSEEGGETTYTLSIDGHMMPSLKLSLIEYVVVL